MARLDKEWLHLLRKYTTPLPAVDVEQWLPELGPLRRVTVRLHPHPLVGKRAPQDSRAHR
jgi:hypothetical protein